MTESRRFAWTAKDSLEEGAMKCQVAIAVTALLFASALAGEGGDYDEFKVKREAVFEFARKPKVSRRGDRVTVAFETKGFCDVTVAIENADGKIVRHLASGVLGKNAPPPFARNSRRQAIVWDGKNDAGRYIDDKESHTVRVSLGLKPRFERTLYWSPYKRVSRDAPLIAACEEGVIVCEGGGVDSVRMYDHGGRYLRTIYPFPAAKLRAVRGLDWKDFPQGVRYPWKQSLYQQTLLTSGNNCSFWDLGGMSGRAASAMAVGGRRLLLAHLKLNRLATDGSSGGAELLGGSTSFKLPPLRTWVGLKTIRATPSSAALSPDGKWLYLAGYAYRIPSVRDTLHGVARIALGPSTGSGQAGKKDAEVFLGKLEVKRQRALGAGSGPGQFRNATSVDCDARGRVYVSDFMNDRVQVFSPAGKYLKEIKTFKPAVVKVNRKSGEIWVFSWVIPSRMWTGTKPGIKVGTTLTRFASFENPRQISKSEIPVGKGKFVTDGKLNPWMGYSSALWFTVDVDFWAEPVTVWLGNDSWAASWARGGRRGGLGGFKSWDQMGLRLLREKNGKWEVIRDFGVETRKEVIRGRPPSNAIQRLQVNPVTGRLYLGEADSGPTCKAHNQLLRIDPETGKLKVVDLPFNAMEYVFDPEGNIYLRNTDMIVRYNSRSFREIPFDYGEARAKLGNDGGIGGRTTEVIAGLPLPSKSPVCYHQGGINVNARGRIIASCGYRFVGITGFKAGADVGALNASGAWSGGRLDLKSMAAQGGKRYTPPIYPGRLSSSTTPCIHVWDKHGKRVYEDAVPGAAQVDGVGIDVNDNIYFMHTPARALNGKRYIDRVSETLTKVEPRKSKVITKGSKLPVPLTEHSTPKRKPDVFVGGGAPGWVQNADWFYGGVGFAGFNAGHAPSCACWFSRFALDYFARSIVPEPRIFSVAVLDSGGNLILRMGKYGNIDDGKPLVPTPGVANPNSTGGDEVALFHACYVGTHTDRRIFISDVGNGRILSVKLGYHAEEKVALKDVPDQARRSP
jgi:hypothetical protein